MFSGEGMIFPILEESKHKSHIIFKYCFKKMFNVLVVYILLNMNSNTMVKSQSPFLTFFEGKFCLCKGFRLRCVVMETLAFPISMDKEIIAMKK